VGVILINQFKQYFECDEGGEVKDYLGCQSVCDRNQGRIKLIQPVIIKSFKNKFYINISDVNNLAPTGSTLQIGNIEDITVHEKSIQCRTVAGNLIYLTK
jgi:hypothetical protein